ncbi:MAG TPA: phage holin family protein [Chloroflexota bacterium]
MQDAEIRRMSTGELVRRLVNNVSGLVDREAELAKQEVKSDAVQVGSGAGILIFGGLMLYTGVAALVVTLIVALTSALQPWAVALIVAVVFLVIGAIVAFVGYRRVRVQPLARTRQTVREDVQWVRAQMTSQAR